MSRKIILILYSNSIIGGETMDVEIVSTDIRLKKSIKF